MSRSFAPQSRSSFSGGGGGGAGGNLSGRALRSTNQGTSSGSASLGRSLGNVPTNGGASSNNRSNFRPSTRDSLQIPSSGGTSSDRAAALRAQLGRGRDDGVNRAAWTEGLTNQGNRFGSNGNNIGNSGGNSNRRSLGQQGSSTLAQQFGNSSNDGSTRTAFQRGQFNGQGGNGRPTNDQVRNFLNLQNRGSDNPTTSVGDANRFGNGMQRGNGGTGDFTGSMQDRALRNRAGGAGDGDALGNRFDRGDGDPQGKGLGGGGGGNSTFRRGNGPGENNTDGPNIGNGGRGGNWRDGNREEGNRGDGELGRGRGENGPDGVGRDGDGRGDGRGGIGRNGDGRGGDGRGDWRDGNGSGRGDRNWRGGELGKGDHRDWSGGWKDGKRFDTARHIRDDWRGRSWNNRRDIPFSNNWWGGRNRWGFNRWNHWGYWSGFYGRPFLWWNWCSAPVLTNWCSFGWSTPYYWDYGPGEYIYCYNNVVYVNGRWFEPAPVYYQRTITLAQSAPEIAPEQAQQIEWLPLGVFAVSRDGVVDNNTLVQLAVTKDGVIGGTVLDKATGTTFDVEGTVDKQSQRAVWTYKDEAGRQVAMETSVYNLTQSEATAMVHYGPDDMKVVELVRLEEPKTDAATNGTTVAKPAATDLFAPSLEAAPADGTLPEPKPAPLPIPPSPESPPAGMDVK
ncbi:MAG: hypothetical protein WD468_07610 [Pirellulales bacterium]